MNQNKTIMTKTKQGLSVHCHHRVLVEYYTDYDGRVDYIKRSKPKNEQQIRLRVFKLLSKEAIKALPKGLLNASAVWVKADANWNKARADWRKARADWIKADADWKGKKQWHKKFCGCSEWNGKKLVFK